MTSAADTHLNQKGFWKDVLLPTSFFFSEKIYNKQSPGDALILLRFLDEVVRHFDWKVVQRSSSSLPSVVSPFFSKIIA